MTDINDLSRIDENLTELLTNTVDMAAVFYDIFLNPQPMDVNLQMYDDNNQLVTVTIPNRAKDRVVPYTGEGSPEGVVEAPVGATYVDTATSTVYYKVSGSDKYGWNAVISQSLMEPYIRTYLEAHGYLTTSYLNSYLVDHEYVDIPGLSTYLNENGYIRSSDLEDIPSLALSNKVMIITDDSEDPLKDITFGNFIASTISSDTNNALTRGSDSKLVVKPATQSVLGAVKIGDGITVESDGTISASGGTSRNIGEIVTSTVPLTDAGLHLADGTLISGSGSYSDFVDYMANLYNSGTGYGVTWEPLINTSSTLTQSIWYCLAYDGTKFVAISDNGYVSTSEDGETWAVATQTGLGSIGSIYGLVYDGTRFIAMSLGGDILVSPDGVTWDDAPVAQLGSYGWFGLAYSGTNYVAISTGGYVAISDDGSNWTVAQNADLNVSGAYWRGLTYGNGKFVALSNKGYTSVSTDGVNWSTAVPSATLGKRNWWSVTSDNTKFIALDIDGYTSISMDGISWTNASQATTVGTQGGWDSIGYGDGRFVAIGTYRVAVGRSIPNYFCSEADWQASNINYGVCNKYVYDSTNNTIRLPKIIGITEGTINEAELGNITEAAIPNIEGSFYIRSNTDADYGTAFGDSGSLTVSIHDTGHSSTVNAIDATTPARRPDKVTLDASLSSSVYQNGVQTVQPQTTEVFYYVVIATSTKTEVEVDIDEIATDLNGKADRDLANTIGVISNSANIYFGGLAMPSNTYTDLTLPASDTSMVAPADGYVNLSKRANSSGQYIYLGSFDASNNELVEYNCIAPANTTLMHVSLPVRKGQTFIVGYTAGGTLDVFRFVYAKGSESEAI